jgi:phosphoglucomutase/phosphomannomutase
MPGAAGMHDMQNLMARFRSTPPQELAGMKVVRVRDYKSLTELVPGKSPAPFTAPAGDMVMLDLAAKGNYVAVRPSGTEPKVKFYMFAYEPAEQIANLEDTKAESGERLKQIERDLLAFAKTS